MRKALCVGIDNYKYVNDLYGCVNDAIAVKAALERNGNDNTLNFSVNILSSTSEESHITRGDLKDSLEALFSGDPEIALFYFSGHGSFNSSTGYLCTSEVKRADEGLALDDLMYYAAKSNAKNKVIILDSCFCGAIGNHRDMPNFAILNTGTVILAACEENQYAIENNGHGVFTSLMTEALYGGAMNLLGEVSPGSVYSYIDKSLGAWEQRPVFKANIKTFVSLRKNAPAIPFSELRLITEIFTTPDSKFNLNPTFEPDKHAVTNKEVNKGNEEVFALLQKYVKLNLVVPVDAEHMYYAAINSKSCKLTAQGQHYWNLVKQNKI